MYTQACAVAPPLLTVVAFGATVPAAELGFFSVLLGIITPIVGASGLGLSQIYATTPSEKFPLQHFYLSRWCVSFPICIALIFSSCFLLSDWPLAAGIVILRFSDLLWEVVVCDLRKRNYVTTAALAATGQAACHIFPVVVHLLARQEISHTVFSQAILATTCALLYIHFSLGIKWASGCPAQMIGLLSIYRRRIIQLIATMTCVLVGGAIPRFAAACLLSVADAGLVHLSTLGAGVVTVLLQGAFLVNFPRVAPNGEFIYASARDQRSRQLRLGAPLCLVFCVLVYAIYPALGDSFDQIRALAATLAWAPLIGILTVHFSYMLFCDTTGKSQSIHAATMLPVSASVYFSSFWLWGISGIIAAEFLRAFLSSVAMSFIAKKWANRLLPITHHTRT